VDHRWWFCGNACGACRHFEKGGLGLWTNLLVGVVGAALGGGLFRLFGITFGLGELKVTFEDLIAAFLGSLIVIFAWRIIAMARAKGAKKQTSKNKS